MSPFQVRTPRPLTLVRSLVAVAALVASFGASAVATVGASGTDSLPGGDFISWSVTPGATSGCSPQGDSAGYTYRYTIGAEFDRVSGFRIPLFHASDVCNLTAPQGWTFAFAGNDLTFFSESEYIAQGGSLDGFGFDSDYDWTKAEFELLGSDGSIFIDPPIPNSAPVAVPVPAPLALLGLGLLALPLTRRTRRQRG